MAFYKLDDWYHFAELRQKLCHKPSPGQQTSRFAGLAQILPIVLLCFDPLPRPTVVSILILASVGGKRNINMLLSAARFMRLFFRNRFEV